MNENGRKTDFLILDEKWTDPRTGVEMISDTNFKVWADAEMKAVIESIEGITWVFQEHGTRFTVYYDLRYDRETLKQEVAAAIKNAAEQTP